MWNGALGSVGEVWPSDTERDLGRAIKLPEKFNSDVAWEKLEPLKERVREVRAIVSSQPSLARTGKKEPDILEVKIDGGTVPERWEFGKKLLGTEVKVTDVFKEGGDVDVVAITKGKGIQGPVKRWGIKKLKHKSRKTVRGVGSIGPWHQNNEKKSLHRAGQMWFDKRHELIKQSFKSGNKA